MKVMCKWRNLLGCACQEILKFYLFALALSYSYLCCALNASSFSGSVLTFHSFPYPDKDPRAHTALVNSLYTLVSGDGTPIGYLLESVFNALVKVPIKIKGELEVSRSKRTICAFNLSPSGTSAWVPPTVTPAPPSDPLPSNATEAERSALVAATTAYWRKNKTFKVLEGWRDELYPVYGPGNELLFSVERSASTLLGVVTYGIHMTGFVRDEGCSYGIKIWVPRRAKNKQTYGGMLDNTVAGGCTLSSFSLE